MQMTMPDTSIDCIKVLPPDGCLVDMITPIWITSWNLVLVVSPNGTIVRANPAWSGILGYDLEETIGKHVDDFAAPEDRALVQELLAKASTGGMQSIEIRHPGKDGSLRWVAWIAALAGAEIYAVGQHITSAKEAEEKVHAAEDALHHAQKVETIGRFTTSVAHDFNNLLSIIHNSVILLRKTDLSEERRIRSLETLARATNQAIAVTRQLLDFARRCPFNPAVFSVAERVIALQGMFTMLCGSEIRIDTHLGEAPLYTLADPSQFDTVLVNLAINARDAMDGKGTLHISIRPASGVYASGRRCKREGSFVAVSMADTGPGIPEEYVDRIFEPFFTTKRAGLGTGMGLPEVADFAERSGGFIEVNSTVGAGATFTMYLPRASAPDGRPVHDVPSGSAASGAR